MADDYQENRRRFLSDFSDDYTGYDYSLPEDFNLDIGSLGSNAELGLNFDWGDLSNLVADPNLFAAFAEANPEDAALLKDLMGGDYGFAPVGSDNPPTTGAEGAGFPGEGIKSGVKEWDDAAKKAGVELTDPNAKTGLAKFIDDAKKGFKDLTGLDAGDAAKYAGAGRRAWRPWPHRQDAHGGRHRLAAPRAHGRYQRRIQRG